MRVWHSHRAKSSDVARNKRDRRLDIRRSQSSANFSSSNNTNDLSQRPPHDHEDRERSFRKSITMSSYLQTLRYFFRLPWHVQWRTVLVQIPRFVPLGVLKFTSPKGPHPFLIALPSRKNNLIPLYVFVPPKPVDLDNNEGETTPIEGRQWRVPVVLDFHGGGFIMGSPLEQAPYAAMMSRELGAVVISVSYRIGPFNQFPAAIHDGEDVLSAILDTSGISKAGTILRTEIQRYYSMMCESGGGNSTTHLNDKPIITLDPTRLSISGFSAGGNIALNMAMSAPACAESLPLSPPSNILTDPFTRTKPPARAPTILDDPTEPWPTILPPSQVQPRMLPLLLFYPSLDAQLLPHERPRKQLPNALNSDDKKPQKPKTPGLFSIMGPTYLPKKLRAHPRASPGLVNPDNIQKNASIFLVLPEKDTLAVQSDVWVDTMNSSGWNGPVRFGDGREGDWNGHEGGPAVTESDENGGLEVWHAPECTHGWTQFPDPFVGKHGRSERDLVFARTLDFVKQAWRKTLPVSNLDHRNSIAKPKPIRLPTQFNGLQE